MKKYFLFVMTAVLLATGCNKDDEIYNRLNRLEQRMDGLEELCSDLNSNINALSTIVDVIRANDYITNVTPINRDGVVIGYTIDFAKSAAITIYNGTTGHSPVIGVKMDTDGRWYWTLDGNWLTDSKGNKVQAAADNEVKVITPQLKIEDGWWMLSTDGQNWKKVGEVGNISGDPVFKKVDYNAEMVYFTLADGSVIDVPRKSSSGVDMKVIVLDVKKNNWVYSNLDNNNFFKATFDMPEITRDVFDNALIKMYRLYDFDTANPAQTELPFVRLNEFKANNGNWVFFTETVDYEMELGKLTVYYTASDFDYELNEQFVPDPMTFRIVIMTASK